MCSMSIFTAQIHRIGESQYVASIQIAVPDGSYEFEFVVTGYDIRAVVSTHEFTELLSTIRGQPSSSWPPILALDMSQGFDVSIREGCGSIASS